MDLAALEREALRVNARYLEEVVEPFDLCPFARGTRTSGGLGRRVLFDEAPSVTSALEAIAAFERDPKVVIGLLLFPRLSVAPDGFDRLVNELREADLARRAPAPFALAAFHPDAPYGAETPQRLVGLFRRTPDPTVQLVRFAALDQVKGKDPPGKFLFDFSAQGWAELERRSGEVGISERIARDNHATALRAGVERLAAILADLRADRNRSYAALASGSSREAGSR